MVFHDHPRRPGRHIEGNKPSIHHLSHVNVRLAFRRFDPNVLTSTGNVAFSCARDPNLKSITRFEVPTECLVRRNRTITCTLCTWTSNNSTTFAKESVLICHHSSPQQIVQRPPRCFGLHLSPFSPWTRPLSGATCLASTPICRCMALSMAVCTHLDRLPLVVFCAKKSK